MSKITSGSNLSSRDKALYVYSDPEALVIVAAFGNHSECHSVSIAKANAHSMRFWPKVGIS